MQIEIIGLAANLSSVVFSNFGTCILNTFEPKKMSIINFLTISGGVAFSLITLNTIFEFEIMKNVVLVSLITIVLRAGFSSFISISFMILAKTEVPEVYTSNVLFWIANLVNFITMEMLGFLDRRICMVIMCFFVVLCIYGGGRESVARPCIEVPDEELKISQSETGTYH